MPRKNGYKKFNRFNCDRGGKRIGKTGTRLIAQERSASFRCVHCKADVPTMAVGTAHRNHCPLCLWSRHVDEKRGERDSDCLASMRPIGLTLKTGGELMVVHRCLKCGKTSTNRIAADDNAHTLLSLFEESLKIVSEERETLKGMGIELCNDEAEVRQIIYGGI